VDAIPFDFRRSELLTESQVQSLQLMHEGFVRNLCSRLSLYLRSEVSGELRSVEQSSFGKLVESLASPTCMLFFRTEPDAGNILVEANQSLVAPILDCVLGGNGKIDSDPAREITDIEKNMLEDFFRILGRQLKETWKPVAPVDFVYDGVETNPPLSKRFDRDEAIVTIAMELRLGDQAGTVNLAIPSMTLKLLAPKSDKPATHRKTASVEKETALKLRLSAGLKLEVECALVGSNLRLRDLLNLKIGDVIDSGIACDGTADILVNGVPKFHGEVALENGRQAVIVQSLYSSC